MVNFNTVTRRISSRLKRYKNYKNRLRLAKVILKNKLPRFFLVHCVYSAEINKLIRANFSRKFTQGKFLSSGVQ